MEVCYEYVGLVRWWDLLSNAGQAAWVQAIAASAGILIAISAPILHASILERRQSQAERFAIHAIASDGYKLIEEALRMFADVQGMQRYLLRTHNLNNFIHPVNALRSIRLYTLKDVRVAAPVMELATMFERFPLVLQDLNQALILSGGVADNAVEKAKEHARGIAMEAKRHVDALAKLAKLNARALAHRT